MNKSARDKRDKMEKLDFKSDDLPCEIRPVSIALGQRLLAPMWPIRLSSSEKWTEIYLAASF